MRRYAVLAPQHFEHDAKTAHGVIRYAPDPVVSVVDPDCAGKRVRDVLSYLESDAPVVATVDDALRFEPTALLIGTAPQGGALPADWRAAILRAIEAKLEIVSGLHDMLGDDPEFRAAASKAGTSIWDVRKPPDVPLFSGAAYDVDAPVVLTIGNDCAVGKMTASLEIVRAARRCGASAEFVPTGQTGVMIAGWGIAVDRVISDFAAGACEQLVLEAARRGGDPIVVEGQGAIDHPAYAPVSSALLFGCAPDALILVSDPSRIYHDGFNARNMSYAQAIDVHDRLLAGVKPAPVVAIALNTRTLSDDRAREEIERARAETGLPADDVVRFGADALYAAISPHLKKRRPV
ncbi:MAG TPA: DUF1611 domain-containing protein [Candidatus Tumulicola sp.]|jgi:uncharacterized NAD-dependent epimerase/dehydratase family protein